MLPFQHSAAPIIIKVAAVIINEQEQGLHHRTYDCTVIAQTAEGAARLLSKRVDLSPVIDSAFYRVVRKGGRLPCDQHMF
jgi:hypothetical protein